MKQAWYRNCFRRNVVDMHIEDWDPSFLSDFDPKHYVEMLDRARVTSTVLYAHSHVGHCYYPTQVGHQHAGLQGRDIFGQTVAECHQHNIAVVGYFSLIFDTHAYRHHPEWRIIKANGEEAASRSRYGVCCPNSGYRRYAADHVRELCERYDLEGIRFDMTFWPSVVCYCPACRKRYASEIGGEIPTIVNWEDPGWVAFQRRREAWLCEFAQYLTETVHAVKPEFSVEHQSSTYLLNWTLGVSPELADSNEFLQGDFYGDSVQGSIARKLFQNMGCQLPFGFETSICSSLQHHTNKKPDELLQVKAAACLADSGAFVLIDAIDLDGKLNTDTYQRIGKVFSSMIPYEKELGGVPIQDVGVYFSSESKFDPADNGKNLADQQISTNQITGRCPHIDALTNVCRSLIEHNLTYGIISRRNLPQLRRYKIIILPNVLMLSEREAQALRDYVFHGGCLYLSNTAGLLRNDGQRLKEFLLSDVLGVTYEGITDADYTYLAPTETGSAIFPTFSPKHPLGTATRQILVQAKPQTEVLATLVLPRTLPQEYEKFASIHSNPPGIWTDKPALCRHRFGNGMAVYCTTDLEASPLHREVFINILRCFNQTFTVTSNAPKPVEMTLFDQPDRHRFRLCLLNFQESLPNIPISGIEVQMTLDKRTVKKVTRLPDGEEISWQLEKENLKINCPRLDDFLMLSIEYD